MASEERHQRRSVVIEKRRERWNRQAMRAVERQQKKMQVKERHPERLNARRLAREDRCSSVWQQRSASSEERQVRQIIRLLSRLDNHLESLRRNAISKKVMAEKRQA